jgi:hypothetical protein
MQCLKVKGKGKELLDTGHWVLGVSDLFVDGGIGKLIAY